MTSARKEDSATEQEKCSCLSSKQLQDLQTATHPLRYYEFTHEEMRALEECDRESFYWRCLPMSTGLMTLTVAAVRSGILKRNKYFGIWPKVCAAMAAGYFGGLAVHQPQCDAKFRKLSGGSHLGNVMRQYYDEKEKLRQSKEDAKNPKPT